MKIKFFLAGIAVVGSAAIAEDGGRQGAAKQPKSMTVDVQETDNRRCHVAINDLRPEKNLFAATSMCGTGEIRRLNDGSIVRRFGKESEPGAEIRSVDLSDEGQMAFVYYRGRYRGPKDVTKLIDLKSGEVVWQIRASGHLKPILHPDGKHVIYHSHGLNIAKLDGTNTLNFFHELGETYNAVLDSTGRYLVVSKFEELELFKMDLRMDPAIKPLGTPSIQLDPLKDDRMFVDSYSMQFSRDEKRLYVSLRNGDILKVGIPSFKVLERVQQPSQFAGDLQVSRDENRWLVVGAPVFNPCPAASLYDVPSKTWRYFPYQLVDRMRFTESEDAVYIGTSERKIVVANVNDAAPAAGCTDVSKF